MKKNIVLTLLLLAGCDHYLPAEYKPKANGNSGYSDQKIAEGEYAVQVYGNEVTSMDTIVGYFHRRAAELCNQKPYHFKLNAGTLYSSQLVPVPISQTVVVPVMMQGIGQHMTGGDVKCQPKCTNPPQGWQKMCK